MSAVALTASACADDPGEDDTLGATRAQLSAGPDVDGMLGLEVAAIGEVTEVVDSNAFRMDKDGITPGVPEDLTPPSPGEAPAYTDLGELEQDSFVNGDEELGTDQEDALVLVPGADLDLSAGDPVRVVGTVRSLDAEAIEEVYGVEIDSDSFAPYLDQLVVVAESVAPAT